MTDNQGQIDLLDETILNETQVKRGGCLKAFLIVMIIANVFTTIFYLYAGESVKNGLPNFPSWGIYLYPLFGIVNTLLAIAVWKWKKIGVYGFIVTALIIFGVNIYFGLGILPSVIGLIGPVILFFLVKPIWKHLQ